VLARARALENQLPVIACNACGTTKGGLKLAGGSLIISADGEVVALAGEGPEELLGEIDLAAARAIRGAIPALAERRPEAYHLASPLAGKIATSGELAQVLARIQAAGGKVVFTNGCFDLLHAGHVGYLTHARSLGDCLVVGLNTDRSVRALKGGGRPVVGERRRAKVLAGLAAVDFVVLFDEDTPLRLIAELQPDVLVKGADWSPEAVVGREVVEARGGRVVLVETVPGASTSALVEAIKKGS
jgi:rfaE bifunctional protein nucleotidyltransferase chain/domain